MKSKMCECFTEIDPNIEEWNDYTGHDEWSAVYTIQLGELIESGVFDWTRPMLDWSKAAYDAEQYSRVCDYFEDRFRFREISIEPFEEWANYLRSRLVYELMPKYRILYAEAQKEWTIATGGKETLNSDNYYKGRVIGSDYPETLLSENSDYITDGKDTEDERVIEEKRDKTVNTSDYVEATQLYANLFGQLDKRLLDECENLFIGMYTTNVNATW